MEKFYILYYYDNWADEIDVNGYAILTEQKYNEIQEVLSIVRIENPLVLFTNFVIGSNEDILYTDLNEIEKSFTMEEITQEEYNMIERLKIPCGFGEDFVNFLLRLSEEYEDEKEDAEEG